jgi:hypothetical protein
MQPVSTVRSFYDAIAAGDPGKVLSLLHADLSWTEAEGFPYFDGTWTRPSDVVEKLLVPLSRDWDGFAATPEEFITDGKVVVAFGTYSGTAKVSGKAMSVPFAHRWECRDGKLQRFNMYTDTLLVSRALSLQG